MVKSLNSQASNDGLMDPCHAWVCREEASTHRAQTQGPLSGFTVGVKDIIVTEDFPTQFGTTLPASAFADLLGMGDASAVAMLRKAGAKIIGKTVTTELATFKPGPTLNPWRHERTPGGSSSGSAAAIATGDVSLALATQTAGSIGRPAAFCGVLGFKPSFDRLTTEGVLMTSKTLDTLGLMAQSVDILQKSMMVLGNLNSSAQATASTQTLVFYQSHLWSTLTSEDQLVIQDFVKKIAPYFRTVSQKKPQPCLANLTKAQQYIHSHEVSEHLGYLLHDHRESLSGAFQAFVAEGKKLHTDDRSWAYQQVQNVRGEDNVIVEEDELWITPVINGVAPMRSVGTGDPAFCRAWTAAGNPTLTVPIAIQQNLPFAVQLVAPKGADEMLLNVAAEIEHLLQKPWEIRHDA
ncbi:amidase [Luminiphilus sp.]|nr:amidase [Luminiphilus sp.]|tara:strand:+ start:984 stop:2204 length:1221 start_codon:yes stop_codon:yes gene_type:complete